MHYMHGGPILKNFEPYSLPQAIIRILLVLCWLDVDPSLHHLAASARHLGGWLLRLLNHWSS